MEYTYEALPIPLKNKDCNLLLINKIVFYRKDVFLMSKNVVHKNKRYKLKMIQR